MSHPDYILHLREEVKPSNRFVPGTQGGKKILLSTDIVDALEIAKRTKRDKTTITAYWMKKPGFPKPYLKLGRSHGWYWPDVKNFLTKEGMLR